MIQALTDSILVSTVTCFLSSSMSPTYIPQHQNTSVNHSADNTVSWRWDSDFDGFCIFSMLVG